MINSNLSNWREAPAFYSLLPSGHLLLNFWRIESYLLDVLTREPSVAGEGDDEARMAEEAKGSNQTPAVYMGMDESQPAIESSVKRGVSLGSNH